MAMATWKSSMKEIYILLQGHSAIKNSTTTGKKSSVFRFTPKKPKSAQFVPAGTLLYKDLQTDERDLYVSLSGSNLSITCSCAPSDVSKLTREEYELLAGIHVCSKRIEVFNDKAWMQDGLKLRPNDCVQITGKEHAADQNGSSGIVKSKGSKDGSPGTWFDIELQESKTNISFTIENIRSCRTQSRTVKLTGGGNDAFLKELRKKQETTKPECTGGMGTKFRSKSMDNLLDDYPKSSKSKSTLNRYPPSTGGVQSDPHSNSTNQPVQRSHTVLMTPKTLKQDFKTERQPDDPLPSSRSHSSSGRTWRRASGPEEDDETKYLDNSDVNKCTTANTTVQRFRLESIIDDDDDNLGASVDNDTTEPIYENVCHHDELYSNDVPGQCRDAIQPASDEEEEHDQDPQSAAEGESLYVNWPIQVSNGSHEVLPSEDQPEESRAVTNDQAEHAGAAAFTVDKEDTYGLFSPQGFFTDYDEVFAPCERRLQELDHDYAGIKFPVNPEDIFDQTYPLDPKQQYTGTCVIFDQFTYDRKGSYSDVRSIYETFVKKFKFRLDYQQNLSKKGFLDVFRKHHDFMADPDNKVQRFVCFILGHGDEQGIMTSVNGHGSRFHVEEGARIDINKDLLPLLSSSRLQAMAGKPKLIFIQACRGHAFQGGYTTQGDADPHDGGLGQQGDSNLHETVPPPRVSIPNDADILVAYAQTSGKQAFRCMKSGSWFIQAITDIFRDYHERYDVLSMMTMVSNAVSYMSHPNPDGSEHKQSPTIQHTLRKKMFMLRATT